MGGMLKEMHTLAGSELTQRRSETAIIRHQSVRSFVPIDNRWAVRGSYSESRRNHMAVNLDKPHLWKVDIARSVDMYNEWFMKFAPTAFRETRIRTTEDVKQTLKATANLTVVDPEILGKHPEILPTLRMSACPPLAVDRLIGLAGVSSSLVYRIEKAKKLPTRLSGPALEMELHKIGDIIERMADPDIFVWLNRSKLPTKTEIHRAATIVADRLCGSVANPIIRNAQEKRQLASVKKWLEARQYRQLPAGEGTKFKDLPLARSVFV